MVSTQKFFNLDLRSLGFIIAITSIFYQVYILCSCLAHWRIITTDNYDYDYLRIVGLFNFIFTITLHKPEQVTTERGDVLSEDNYLQTFSDLIDGMSLVSLIVSLIVCPLLLVALIKKKPGLILPWLIYWAVSLIFNWVICVVLIIYMTSVDAVISAEHMSYMVHQSMAMGLYFALWVAMVSLREEEKNGNTS